MEKPSMPFSQLKHEFLASTKYEMQTPGKEMLPQAPPGRRGVRFVVHGKGQSFVVCADVPEDLGGRAE